MDISEREIEAKISFKVIMTENFPNLEAIWISKFMKLLTPQIQPEEVFIQIQYYKTVRNWHFWKQQMKLIQGTPWGCKWISQQKYCKPGESRMELEGALKSENNTEKEEQIWKAHTS